MLYTARSMEFMTQEGIAKAVANCEKRGIDGIIAIGGDGTFRGAVDSHRRRCALHRHTGHDRQRYCLHGHDDWL